MRRKNKLMKENEKNVYMFYKNKEMKFMEKCHEMDDEATIYQ